MTELEYENHLKEIKENRNRRLKIEEEYNEKIKLDNHVLNVLVLKCISFDEIIKMNYEELSKIKQLGPKKIKILYDTLKTAGYDVNHIILPLTKEELEEKIITLINENYEDEMNSYNYEINNLFKGYFFKQIKKMTTFQLTKYINEVESILAHKKKEQENKRCEILFPEDEDTIEF